MHYCLTSSFVVIKIMHLCVYFPFAVLCEFVNVHAFLLMCVLVWLQMGK